MKTPIARFILIAALLASGAGGKAAAQAPPPVGAVPNAPAASQGEPQIQFDEMEHDFGKIEHGAIVKHDFGFINTGTAMLEVTGVRPSCGCTTTGPWSRRAEPGQAGIIPIQLNSGTISGEIHKTVTVISNAPGQPLTLLKIKATIWKPIDVTPSAAYFTPLAGAKAAETKVVRIVNNTEEPLELSPPASANDYLAAELKTIKPGKEFEVSISTKPPFEAGARHGSITLKTSSKKLPVIIINGIVMVQLPITAAPAQVVLGPAPLAVATQVGVTLRHSGGGAVAFSEPSVNVPGVDATLKELQPGRVVSVKLSFPAGFEVKSATTVELSVRTSHSEYPVVRVPIFHGPNALQPRSAGGQPESQGNQDPPRTSSVTEAVAIPIPQPMPPPSPPAPQP